MEMRVMGENVLTLEQVLETRTTVPTREQIVKNDVAKSHYWRPVSDAQLLTAIIDVIENSGLQIVKSSFAVNKTGHHLVGAIMLKDTTGEILPVLPGNVEGMHGILIDHANDMSRKLRLLHEIEARICTNGCTSGKDLMGHKHTSGFDVFSWTRENLIPNLVNAANDFGGKIKALQDMEISDQQAEHICVEAGMRELLPKARVFDVIQEWREPVFDRDVFVPGTAWKLYNDFTHVAKLCSPHRQLEVCEGALELIAPNLAASA